MSRLKPRPTKHERRRNRNAVPVELANIAGVARIKLFKLSCGCYAGARSGTRRGFRVRNRTRMRGLIEESRGPFRGATILEQRRRFRSGEGLHLGMEREIELSALQRTQYDSIWAARQRSQQPPVRVAPHSEV